MHIDKSLIEYHSELLFGGTSPAVDLPVHQGEEDETEDEEHEEKLAGVFRELKGGPANCLVPIVEISCLPVAFHDNIMFGKILDTASLLKAKLARDELDQALIEATNDDNWQASTAVLHEIASSAYAHDKWKRINDFLTDKLRNSSRWKKILKAMNIVQFLLKNGPAFAVDQLRRELTYFRTLESYQAYEEGTDRGAPIRERARAIVGLMTNEDLLEDERVRARQIRERMSHLSGTTNYTTGAPTTSTAPKYESYNSETFGKGETDNNKEFYNYGHGNYGDREYDKHHRDDYFDHVSRKIDSPQRPTQETQKQTKKVEAVKAKPIEPIVTLSAAKKEDKGTYETMAQRLMKSKPARTEVNVPVVPDLSYKKKEVEDLLIDTEANFIENRYHFQTPQPQAQYRPESTYTPPPQQAPQPSPPTQRNNQVYTPPPVTTPTPTPNLLSEMDGLLFLGVQQAPKVQSTPLPIAQTPLVQQTPINPVISSSPASIPPSQAQSQIPPPQSISYSQLTMNQPGQQYGTAIPAYGGYYNVPPVQLPPAYSPYGQSGYQPYRPVSMPTNPYAPPPYYGQQQFYSPYQAPPQYSNYQSPMQQISYPTPPTPLPYYSPADSKPVAPPSQPTKNEQDFGDFKNGGSFEMQKISWMSSKEKNLTDLTDFTIDPKDRQRQAEKPKKVDFSNNIRIDPWAW